jgi:thiamine-phosphate pyrophosphorylase
MRGDSKVKNRRQRLKQSRLYLVLDTQVGDYSKLMQIAKQAVRAGVDIVQLRDKQGRLSDTLRWSEKINHCLQGKALFIVNDRPDIAVAVGADGVHLGQDDFPFSAARRILGQECLIGVSCQTGKQVVFAQNSGADYVGLGSVNTTFTKPDRLPLDRQILRQVLAKTRIPVFPIGGITLINGKELVDLGARRLAVTRAICLADDIKTVVREFRQMLVGETAQCV